MKLSEIQQKLKAPKSQRNSFGNYNYRNCEDTLEAVKPLLGDSVLTLSDEVVALGQPSQIHDKDGKVVETGVRFYVKATATFVPPDGGVVGSVSVTAYARESFDKKGMDSAQITGAASSYARKYALNGLFLIDDTKDADHSNDDIETKPTTKKDKFSL